jgi:hypothetical protein
VELFVRAKQKKEREEADQAVIRLQFVTRSLFDYFPSEFLESIHRRICNMVCVITDYF